MTAQQLIEAAAENLGLLGDDLDASELERGLSSLQSMLRAWAGERLNVFYSTKESFSLVSGTSSYTWGSGGTFATTRPDIILGAYILDSANISHPVDIITEGQYRNIAAKTTSSRPYALFFYPTYPLAYIYLYPVPDQVETLYIDSVKPFTETSSFDALASTLAFPPSYEEALIYNLSVRLAPKYGKTTPPEVITIAANSYTRLINRNAMQQVEPVVLVLPYSAGGGRYNINSDTYR